MKLREKPVKKKLVKEEDLEALTYELKHIPGLRLGDPEVKDIIKAITNSGFVKKGLFGIREYQSPIVLFMQEDGGIEIKEEAASGILRVEEGGETRRFVLDPKKMFSLPNPLGDDYKCWVHYEAEAFSYPCEVVYDASVFNNIMIQYEANQMDEDFRLANLNIRKWGMIIFGIIFILGVIFTNWDLVAPILGLTPPAAANAVTGTP